MSEPFRDPSDPPRVHYSFKPTEHGRVSDQDKAAHPDSIDVRKILKDNVTSEARRHSSNSRPENYKSRRKRDYLILVTIPNVLLAIPIVVFRTHSFFLIAGLSLMVLYTAIVTWVIWFVMDDN